MKSLKNDLRVVTKELKALAKKTEKVMKAVDKLEKAKAAPKRKPKAKAKVRKKAPAKRAVAKKAVRKKAVLKKAAPKKAASRKGAALTATDQVLKIIKRTKKGVDAPTLMKKTGFEDKKIRNILMRASKQGKIKRAARGIYVAA
ncbi:MAG: hypothetical protein JSV01_08235 [Desulfobacterales bacterium]|nr:MAG: hypothetical protein JSV01_08235 [Desulfobacterales bacterium]